jgi:hypothetical protein
LKWLRSVLHIDRKINQAVQKVTIGDTRWWTGPDQTDLRLRNWLEPSVRLLGGAFVAAIVIAVMNWLVTWLLGQLGLVV